MQTQSGSTVTATRDLPDTVQVNSLEVDRAPVTNARYAAFVEATGHRPPLYWPNGQYPRSLADHPVVGVDFFDAFAFALWAGGCLPTELEWVEATGLTEQRAYVWGDKFDGACCNTVRSGLKRTTPVGAFPEGTAPSGCVDMCGNVWEMTCSTHPEDPESIIVKGGSWYDFPVHAQVDARFRARMNKCLNTVGFRLVYGRKMRLPGILDPDLVAECIAFRQPQEEQVEEGSDGWEFTEVVERLREEAATHIPALDLDDPTPMAINVAEALTVFDVADAETGADVWCEEPERPGLRDRIRAAVREIQPRATVRALRQRCREAGRRLLLPGKPWQRFKHARLALRRTRFEVPLLERLRNAVDHLGIPEAVADFHDWSQAFIVRRPRTVFVALCIAVGMVLGTMGAVLTSDEADAQRIERSEAELGEDDTAPRRADRRARTARPANATASRRNAPAPVSRDAHVDRAIRDIVSGTPHRRDEGERYLIWHGDESYARVRAALSSKVSPTAKSSFRYVLAGIEEERSPPVSAVLAWEPPKQGLLVFCDQINSQIAEEITKVRRTGKAEQMDVTVVFATSENPDGVARNYASTLGDTRLFVDKDGNYTQQMRIKQTPAVAGLHADGRLGFLLFGTVPRSRLSQNVTRLTR